MLRWGQWMHSMHWKQQWVLFSIFIFLIFLANRYYNRSNKEDFSQLSDVLTLIQKAKTTEDALTQYNAWVGYMYQNPPQNSVALNDIKKRMFQPSCLFRDDWSTNLPSGKNRPIPASSQNIANMAYKNYLACLSRPDGLCITTLADVRDRFFAPGCDFLNPSDPASYSQNFQTIF
jgi:hypothetical protein